MTTNSEDQNQKSEKKKTNETDLAFKSEFKYSHDNPYHERLEIFDKFVMRDDEAEKNPSLWAKNVFGNTNPIEMEIGTGYGHFMQEYTQKNPDLNFVGLDHRFKRSFHLAKKLSELKFQNFRYLRARAERLSFIFGENELSKIFYFFPDPWPKKRHLKKRLFQKKFLDEAYKVLHPNGQLLVKTDHDGYFEWMLEELKDEKRFRVDLLTWNLREEHPEHFLASFTTKFEKIFLEKQIKIKALVLTSLKS